MPTPSHTYDFTVGEFVRRLLGPVLGVALMAALLHAASRGHLLPAPVPADLDRTIVAAKADLASASRPTAIVLLGDSSCMMDVDASELAHQLGQPVLNLGTLSFLDVAAHTALFRHALRHLPAPPGDVVALLHPGSLRRGSSLPELDQFLRAHLAGASHDTKTPPRHQAEAWLGGVIVREQIIQPWIPCLLHGEFATAYGTTRQVGKLLRRQAGSLLDPTPFDPTAHQGRYEFRLNPGLESASRELKTAVPSGSRCWVGLTPVPESLALPDHASQVRALLDAWSAWLQPDRVLTNLPAVLPDRFFATATHLNAAGVADFTERLATELRRSVNAPTEPPPKPR